MAEVAGMTRLFVAVWPPGDVLDALGDVERPNDPGVKWVPQENLHLTLRFLGDADADDVIERLEGIELPSTTVTLGPAFDLFTERSLLVPAAGLDELAAVVRRALRGLGTEPERRRFLGHLTVARLARGARPARSAGRRFDATFDVTDVALVESTLHQSGARYETITTWPTRSL